ncbi:hypothetical protein D3C79_686400 [compost metagenome]
MIDDNRLRQKIGQALLRVDNKFLLGRLGCFSITEINLIKNLSTATLNQQKFIFTNFECQRLVSQVLGGHLQLLDNRIFRLSSRIKALESKCDLVIFLQRLIGCDNEGHTCGFQFLGFYHQVV